MADKEHFRELSAIGRRDGVRKIGRKAWALARLSRAGVTMPQSWVLEARHFERFAERALPPRHDLRALIKLSGTRAGDESCARAYEELIAEPLDDALVEAIERLWQQEKLSELSQGVAVRPSVAATGSRIEYGGRHLHARLGASSPDELAQAIRDVWASAVLAWTVAAYAEADLRDASIAILVQEVVAAREVGIITRTTSPTAHVAEEQWHLGTLLETSDSPWRRRAQLLLPMSLGQGGQGAPEPLARLRAVLEPDGFEQLIELGEIAVRELGDGAVIHFAPERRDDRCHIHILNADSSPRWLPLTGGDERTTWAEITLGGRTPEPSTRLTQSIVEGLVESTIGAGLALLRSPVEDTAFTSSWSGRSYLNLDALVAAVRDVPFLSPEDLLTAVGGAGQSQLREVAGRAAAHGRSMWRMPFVGIAALKEQLSFESELSRIERSIERAARGLADLDVGILPNDGIGTTLASAQTLLERTTELWLRATLSIFSHHLAIQSLVGRRVPDVEPKLGLMLVSGAGELYAATMADAFWRLVEIFRRDSAAVDQLRRQGTRLPSDLPDGMARGALGQFLSRYGELCFGPFELSRPRWREDARELLDMVLLTVDLELDNPVERVRAARASADAELARHEPELGPLERRALRELVDRMGHLVRRRANVDRLVFGSLFAVRRVALDIDRRLRRIDRSLDYGGSFHCSAARLRAALKSGRPELGRVIQMRILERQEQGREPAPPLSFVASPPRGAIPLVHTGELDGIGVSPGVVEGRVRLVREVLPPDLEAGDILVLPSFEIAHAPLALVCAGVVAEAGGTLSPGAEALRELAIPAAFSVAHAGLLLKDGEHIRLDGERGVVRR